MDQIKTTIWSERVFCVQTAEEEDDELQETVTEETRWQGIGYRSDEERIIEIELERLRDFKNHPFRVTGSVRSKGMISFSSMYLPKRERSLL